MEKKDFHQLLNRYVSGNCSKEEVELIEQWYAQIADPSLQLNELEKIEIEEKIYAELQKNITFPKKEKQALLHNASWRYSAAAAVVSIITIACCWLVFKQTELPSGTTTFTHASKDNVVHENVKDTAEVIILPDGSKVTLKPGSHIEYNPHANTDIREVKLVGEAFFDVVKDSKRPFYVYGGNVITKVLGTSFSVNAPAHSSTIQVEVRTGRVSVYSDRPSKTTAQDPPLSNGVVLTPNQKVTYFTEENHWVTSLVEIPQAVRAEEKLRTELVFNNTPLHEIVKHLEDDYGIEIIIEDEKILSCTFTGDVSEMPLYDALNFIGKSIRTEYEIRGTKILINGEGCF